MATEQVSEFAPAKINLCLHVTGQRADGYHLLDSLVAFAGVGDRVTARRAEALSLALSGPFGADLPSGDDNLVLRAARLAQPGLAAALALDKHLPPASGIGGGSADAAATVRALDRLAGAAAPRDAAGLAALGADVPVCLGSARARMRGIGDRLDPVTLPPGWILLVNPRIEVPTPAVFRALAQKDNAPLPKILPAWPDLAALARWLQDQRNDLQAPALALAPVIGTVLELLEAQPGARIARMSGSGATCFALFTGRAEARAAAAAIGAAQPGWWVAEGPLLPADQAMRATT